MRPPTEALSAHLQESSNNRWGSDLVGRSDMADCVGDCISFDACGRSRQLRRPLWLFGHLISGNWIGFWQLDRDVLSAHHLGRSIWIPGRFRVGGVTNKRFQCQKELFGKHGVTFIAIACHLYDTLRSCFVN